MTNPDPAKRLGEILPAYTMKFERESKHPPARLWRAITDPVELAKWMSMPSARVELRAGGEYYVEFPPGQGALEGIVVRVEPERTLAYVWGQTVIEWILTATEQGTRFTFTHYGQPPRAVDEEEGLPAGWHTWLEDLEVYLGGGTPAYGDRRWRELMPAYRARIERVLAL